MATRRPGNRIGAPPKVLHAYTQHRGRGGAELQIAELVEMSRRKGLQVEVFTRDSSDLAPNLVGRIQAATSAIYGGRSLGDFDATLRSFEPDIVHIHDLFPLISPRILPLCARRKIPVIMSCIHFRLSCPVTTHFRDGAICTDCAHGRDHWALLNNCRKNLAESLIVSLQSGVSSRMGWYPKYVSLFIAPSDSTRRWLIDNAGLEPDKVSMIHPFIDLPDTPADPAQGNYIGFAGRFVVEKGIDTAVEAARISGLPFRLYRNARGRVEMKVPPEADVVVTHTKQDLHNFYRGARVITMPSLWMETFGIVGAEAMSHGIPVLASRIGALAELVDDGRDGLLFEAGNAQDLAAKARVLWNDTELCRRMGIAARKKALASWGRERYFSQMYALYERLLSKEVQAPAKC